MNKVADLEAQGLCGAAIAYAHCDIEDRNGSVATRASHLTEDVIEKET